MTGQTEQQGKKNAVPTWAIVVALLGLLSLCCGIMYPIYRAAMPASPRAGSVSNLRQLALGHEMYSVDFDGLGPSPETWADQIMEYVRSEYVYRSPHIDEPMEERKEKFGFAYYRPLGGIDLEEVMNAEEVPLVFDSSDLRWNANGDLSLLPDPPRWDGKNLIAFLDTHVKAVEGRPKVEIKLP